MTEPTPPNASQDSGEFPTKGAVSALVILTLINFMSAFDRVQIPTIAQPLKLEFSLSDTQLGLLTGLAFGLSYSAATIPLAWISDRWRRVPVVIIALAFWSVMTGLGGFAKGFWHLFLTRVGVAVGESSFTPNAHSILAGYYPPKKRALAIGIETTGLSLGYMAGLSVCGWVATIYGWRAALMLAAIPGLILSVAAIVWLKEPPRVERAPVATSVRGWRFGKGYPWLVASAVCFTIMATGWNQWLPAFFMRVHEIPLSTVGMGVGLASGFGLTTGSFMGGLLFPKSPADRPRSPFLRCAVVSLLILPVAAAMLWIEAPSLSFILLFFTTALANALGPVVYASIQNNCGPAHRARAAAIALTFVGLTSYAVMPVAVGRLSDTLLPTYGSESLRVALTALLFIPVVGALIFLKLHVGSRPGKLGEAADR
jgi:predicted MFS family arabinose efflux permease